jgi:outer membrane protein assembly factor BamB
MNVYCISTEGKLVWKYKTQEVNWWKPAVHENRVFFGSYDCFFYSLDSATGAVIWKFRSEGSPSKYPSADEYVEMVVDIPANEEKEERKKGYELDFLEEKVEGGSFYKSRITYQISTQYAAKGTYQKDSDLDEF